MAGLPIGACCWSFVESRIAVVSDRKDEMMTTNKANMLDRIAIFVTIVALGASAAPAASSTAVAAAPAATAAPAVAAAPAFAAAMADAAAPAFAAARAVAAAPGAAAARVAVAAPAAAAMAA